MQDEPRTYKITEISNALDLSLAVLREWKNRDLLPFSRGVYGSTKRYTLEEVQLIYIAWTLKNYGVGIKTAFDIGRDYFDKPVILVRRKNKMNTVIEPHELPEMVYDYVRLELEKIRKETATALEIYT